MGRTGGWGGEVRVKVESVVTLSCAQLCLSHILSRNVQCSTLDSWETTLRECPLTRDTSCDPVPSSFPFSEGEVTPIANFPVESKALAKNRGCVRVANHAVGPAHITLTPLGRGSPDAFLRGSVTVGRCGGWVGVSVSVASVFVRCPPMDVPAQRQTVPLTRDRQRKSQQRAASQGQPS